MPLMKKAVEREADRGRTAQRLDTQQSAVELERSRESSYDRERERERERNLGMFPSQTGCYITFFASFGIDHHKLFVKKCVQNWFCLAESFMCHNVHAYK